ncbi:DUF502 domain-containing protein [Aquipseudomonas ullengensis]|uniref:DUF502 domain-containing protein n=1 Tax=Aquipseudomonas ullengensis TaxID=2759166 RepID=A0A7W4LKB4_9GAMM|nr:hypothetical protein [Pseudomonas ullengensis]MBB2494698.1 hypothetical protein [Pseudomonas ullengensis]
MFKFIKTTVAGGLLFILPLVLIAVLVQKAVHLLRGPIQKLLPMFGDHAVAGVTLFSLVAFVALILLCFFAGLLAKTAPAQTLRHSLEDKVLSNLPGYQLLKDATTRLTGMESLEGVKVGLIAEGDGWRICLVFEAQGDWLTIYIPDGGPAGSTAGEVRLMPASAVRVTDMPWLPLLGSLRRGGRGALEMAMPWLEKA